MDRSRATLDGGGAHTDSIRMPSNLPRIDFYFQTFILDPGAANGLFATTAGLRASVL